MQQQYIEPDIVETQKDAFPGWLNGRADRLAEAGNKFLESLREGLNLPPVLSDAAPPDHAYDAA